MAQSRPEPIGPPVAHAKAKCCWCDGPLYRIGPHFWCKTPACVKKQRAYGIGVKTSSGFQWLYVPVPKQVNFEHQRTKYGLYGGAAGGSKAVALDTPIPSPDGATLTMGSLKVGDAVFDEHGQRCCVEWKSEAHIDPTGTFRLDFKTGDSIIAGGGHEWPSWTRQEITVGEHSPSTIRSTTDLLWKAFHGERVFIPHVRQTVVELVGAERVPDVLVQCIRVNSVSHCFLCGDGLVTHNSHGARWALYRYALTVPNFEALLLRKSFPELEKTHLRRMAREERILKDAGIDCDFKKTDKQMVFHKTNAIVEAGHMEDKEAVDKYLSTEYDGIACDEGSGYDPDALLELSTRTARTNRPEMEAAGGSFFWVLTNPGGPASRMLVDMFIDHTPDFERYPNLKTRYDPAQWRYVEAVIEDNPYLDPSYEDSLAVLGAIRYEQLRHANWRVFSGQFFSMWREKIDGRPHHVIDLQIRGPRVLWFRSMDWGRSNPGCVLWCAILPDRHYHVAAELKFLDMDPKDVAAEIRNIDAMLGIEKVLYTAVDPAMFITQQQTGTSIADSFRSAGMILRPKISNDRIQGWARVRELLGVDGQGRPWLTVSPNCKYLCRTLPIQLMDPHNPEDIDTDGDDHGVDSLRYMCMSQPPPPRYTAPPAMPGTLGFDLDKLREEARDSEA